MSYTEQAEKINLQFQDLKVLDEITKEKLINAILWFGQVAKFRCRSNSAYDNFTREVFKDIAEIKREVKEGFDFEVLRYVGI